MIRSFAAGILLVLAAQIATAEAMTAADVKRCNAMAATLAPKKAEIQQMQEKRDAMAETVEAKGDIWEELEVHRLASAGHAAQADAAKADYESSKKDLMKTEFALQALARQFNQDIASYNQSCATK